MLMDRTKSLTERRAEAMANRAGYAAADQYRPFYLIGVMGAEAENLERVLDQIASGKLSAANARRLAKDTLDSLKGGA
jgi:hypothetical protein